ncbi:MAG: DUF423 domain-containing protein [Alphaproteobacteria bacterium]|nr:DUF423 domain-containing protein [Alphaproteobacteria bacterium]
MRVTGPVAFLGALSGFACVAIGAFGEHALSDPHAKDLVETGVRYHILHTMAAFASLSFRNWGAPLARHAPPYFFAGIILFSGSLYAMAVGAPRWFGMITPLGGVSLLLGWAIMARAGYQLFQQSRTST